MRLTGYAVVEAVSDRDRPRLVEAGVIRLSEKDAVHDRLRQLHEELRGIIDELRPQRMVVEKLFAHYKHPASAILMGHARGVILLAACQAGLAIEHVPATRVKKALTGNGHASKRQMQLAVQSQCGLAQPPSPPDVADAIAIALVGVRRAGEETGAFQRRGGRRRGVIRSTELI